MYKQPAIADAALSVCVLLHQPGGSNDIAAFRKTPLAQLVTQLPLGKYLVGDNAYVCSESLLTPFATLPMVANSPANSSEKRMFMSRNVHCTSFLDGAAPAVVVLVKSP